MSGLFDFLRPKWPLLAALVSGALLAGAHAFQTFGHMKPCVLCLAQRERHWIILGISAVCFLALLFVKDERVQRVAALLIALGFGWSVYEAGHHVAVEQKWIPATCEVGNSLDEIAPLDLNGTFERPNCDQIAWQMLGISMAGYNFLISLAMCVLSLGVAALPKAKSS